MRNSATNTPEYAYVQSLFDALIQLGTSVPADVLLPFERQSTAEVILLLAHSPENEKALLSMMDQKLTAAERLTVSNQLFEKRSQPFFQKTLAELAITHVFEVKDADSFSGRCGGASGTGLEQRRFTEGFPPIALYQLDFSEFGARSADDEIIAFPGPHNVYYRRNVIATNGEETWPDRVFFPGLNAYRLEYLAILNDKADDELSKLFFAYSRIRWQDAAQFNEEASMLLTDQASQIHEFLIEMRHKGLDTQSMAPKIVPTIYDSRKDKRDPIPSLVALPIP